MTPHRLDDALNTLPAPAPLAPEGLARVRERVRHEARAMRGRMAEAGLHAGFAVGALAWAAAAVFG